MNIHFNDVIRSAELLYLGFAKSVKTQDALNSTAWIKHAFRDTAKFRFDQYPDAALEDFGLELLREELLSLPFDACYFEWDYEEVTQALLALQHDDDMLLWNWQKAEGKWGGTLPYRFSRKRVSRQLRASGHCVGADEASMFGDLTASIETSIGSVAACVGLLSAKGVAKEVVETRPAVNAKRVARGKEPFHSYTYVRTTISPRRQGQGSHASPRPHFRRGHIRHLEEKMVQVRPHFVMADPGEMPTYKVKNQ